MPFRLHASVTALPCHIEQKEAACAASFFSAAATAAVIAVAAAAVVAAAVAQQEHQNDDPPPVVVQASAQTVIITHNPYLRKDFELCRSIHGIPGREKCAGIKKLPDPNGSGSSALISRRRMAAGRSDGHA